jgi:hypothetical protein
VEQTEEVARILLRRKLFKQYTEIDITTLLSLASRARPKKVKSAHAMATAYGFGGASDFVHCHAIRIN